MVIVDLIVEFFQIGLFAIGGGMATIPFLIALVNKYDWFSYHQLMDMIAISQSTPGPVGINMATYAGYNAAGLLGAIIATFALVTPAVIVIIIVAHFLEKFKTNETVQAAFYGIRPAVAALIGYAVLALLQVTMITETKGIKHFEILSILICALCFLLMQFKWGKKVHPIAWIGIGAVIGIVLSI